MPIDRSLDPLFSQDDFEMGPEGLMVAEEEEALGDSLVTEMEDGSNVVDLDPMAMEMGMGSEESFESNLAEHIDDSE